MQLNFRHCQIFLLLLILLNFEQFSFATEQQLEMALQSKNQSTQDTSEVTCQKVALFTLAGVLLLDVGTCFSKTLQAFIFGGTSAHNTIKNNVASLAKQLNIQTISTINHGYKAWHYLLGPVFSNHTTLFVNHELGTLLQQPISSTETLTHLSVALVNIDRGRDNNILIGALVIPALMYGLLKGVPYCISKLSSPGEWMQKVKRGIEVVENHATLITLMLLYGFIKIQDYRYAQEAKMLIDGVL